MSKRMLHNPVSGGDSFREVFVTTPDVLAKIAELEAQLAIEKAKPPIEITREILTEKEVFRDDPSLLLKYNHAMKELGILKRSQTGSQPIIEQAAEITKLVYIKVLDKRYIIASAIGGFALGVALCIHHFAK